MGNQWGMHLLRQPNSLFWEGGCTRMGGGAAAKEIKHGDRAALCHIASPTPRFLGHAGAISWERNEEEEEEGEKSANAYSRARDCSVGLKCDWAGWLWQVFFFFFLWLGRREGGTD